MPRNKYLPTVRREIYLPTDLAEVLELLLLDPVKGKARYGSINTYINSLIRDDLRKRGILPQAGEKPLDILNDTPYNPGNFTTNTQEPQP